MSKSLKYLLGRRADILALLLILLAMGIRIALLISGWPAVNSEEGTFGLEAMHIAYRGEFPVFMYGQDYMGTLEAYVGALLFHLFGVSWFTLGLSMALLFALFLVSIYFLTKLLYSAGMGLFILLLLCFGSIDMLIPETMMVGGAVETLIFGTLLLLLATRLSLSARQQLSERKRWLRFAGFAAWGCCAGLGLWSHLLVTPFVLVSALLLLIFCHKEILSFAPVALLLGFVLGLLPLILYNLYAAPGHSSLDAFLAVYATGSHTHLSLLYRLIKQFIGTFFFALPTITGLNPLYPSNPLPLPYFSSTRAPLLSILTVGGWSLGYVLLFVLACYMAGKGLRQLRKLYPGRGDLWNTKDRQMAVIYTAQLMLLLAATITIALFAFSSNAASRPWSTRYLIGLLVAMPAVLWPLWNGVNTYLARFGPEPTSAFPALIFRRALLILLVCFFAYETVFATAAQTPANIADNAQVQAITHDLTRMGITHLYSGYWQCERFMFQTQEALTCAVVAEDISKGFTRYKPYYVSVHNDPNTAYVFPVNSAFANNFERKSAAQPGAFEQIFMDGYVVYIPQH
ncbi:MAG TPA: hypothetical protein VGD98_13090 [Ktedonobacteraceae bacterium]